MARTIDTTKRVARNRPLLIFIIAFMLFNDAVQTTIAASVTVAAFFLPSGAAGPFLALAVVIGFVLGGTQERETLQAAAVTT